MEPVEIKQGVYWVGAIDWDLRYFHGYQTPRGSSYNAYLIIDRDVILVDTVKEHLYEEMVARIRKIVEPSTIKYIVANHVEQDHSGSIPQLLELCPGAQVVTSPRGKQGLEKHFQVPNNYLVVKSGESLDIGVRSLYFMETPMVHWPDSMATYLPQEKLLFPNDAFGQHIASSQRFDHEMDWYLLEQEAAKYYANIVLPYGDQVNRVLDLVQGLDIEMIAPSHGLIWRKFWKEIIDSYRRWADNETESKAVIVYDTMWGSTQRIAQSLRAGLEKAGIPVTMRFLQTNHISEIMADVLEARGILIGSPTLNNGMLPSVSSFLTYVKGLRPKNRTGMAFGSYGWGGQGAKEVAEFVQSLGWQMPFEVVNVNYCPSAQELEAARKAGEALGRFLSRESR